MSFESMLSLDQVGPVLQSGTLAAEMANAIRHSCPEATVIDRGGYLRIVAPRRCLLSREVFEQLNGRPLRLPNDLESVMSSFRGQFTVTEDEAIWEAP